jgi:hypothetical protein
MSSTEESRDTGKCQDRVLQKTRMQDVDTLKYEVSCRWRVNSECSRLADCDSFAHMISSVRHSGNPYILLMPNLDLRDSQPSGTFEFALPCMVLRYRSASVASILCTITTEHYRIHRSRKSEKQIFHPDNGRIKEGLRSTISSENSASASSDQNVSGRSQECTGLFLSQCLLPRLVQKMPPLREPPLSTQQGFW